MKIFKTANYKKIRKKAIGFFTEENQDKYIPTVDNIKEPQDARDRTNIGYDLSDFDMEFFDSPERDSVTVDEDSSFIHNVSLHLIGEVEDIYVEEYQGAIRELGDLLDEQQKEYPMVTLNQEQISEVVQLQKRLYNLMQKEHFGGV